MVKRNKKGFTLAELLIVVAIIAVLTAIAVPLFVTSLNDARKSADEYNIRALQSYAVTKILDSEYTADGFFKDCYDPETKMLYEDGYFKVTATLNDDKSYTITKIEHSASPDATFAKVDGKTVTAIVAVSKVS